MSEQTPPADDELDPTTDPAGDVVDLDDPDTVPDEPAPLDGPGLDWPYPDDFDGHHDPEGSDDPDTGDLGPLGTSYPMAPHSTQDAMEWHQRAAHGPNVWDNLCLALARQARGVPSRYYSAKAAQDATPAAQRVQWGQLQRGHIGYFDRVGDSNPFGHIATCAGRTPDGRLRWWTNDARVQGGVSLVIDPSRSSSWFGTYWNAPFTWGASWVNGYDFNMGGDQSRDVQAERDRKYGSGAVYVQKLRQGQQHSDSVRRLKWRLTHHSEVPKHLKADIVWDGTYGGGVVRAVQWWQRNIASKSDYDDGKVISDMQANRLFGDQYHVVEVAGAKRGFGQNRDKGKGGKR